MLLGGIVIGAACTEYPRAPTEIAGSPRTIEGAAAYSAATHRDTVLIDVREPDEIEQGGPDVTAARIIYRLDRSRDVEFVDQMLIAVTGDRTASIVLMCASGVRSAAARDLLLKHGFTDVKSLRGGFRAWQQSRLPIIAHPSSAD